MVRNVSLVVMASFLLFAVGCGGSKPKDLIVGKWNLVESADMPKDIVAKMQGTMEFKSDGELVMNVMGMSKSGKYKFVSDDTMEAELGGKAKKLKVDIKGEDLTTTEDGTNKVDKFKKAK
jgi:hypothetical protein